METISLLFLLFLAAFLYEAEARKPFGDKEIKDYDFHKGNDLGISNTVEPDYAREKDYTFEPDYKREPDYKFEPESKPSMKDKAIDKAKEWMGKVGDFLKYIGEGLSGFAKKPEQDKVPHKHY